MRSEECCENCHFSGDYEDGMLPCLRYPPVFVSKKDDGGRPVAWGQPVMWAEAWCGEYKEWISTDA
jgi:hypothetical protein